MIIFDEEDIINQITQSNNLRQNGENTNLNFTDNGTIITKEKTLLDKAGAILSSIPGAIGDFAVGAVKGMPIGASKAGEQIMDTITNQAYTKEFVPFLKKTFPVIEDIDNYINNLLKPEGTAQEVGSMIGEATTQIVAPGAMVTKSLQGANLGGKFITNVLGYGSAEALALSPKDQGLLELGVSLFAKNDELKNEIVNSLKANEDLPFLVQKLQKAPQRFFEGGIVGEGIGKAIEGVGVLYRAMKGSDKIKNTLQNIGEKAQGELDLDGTSSTLSSMGGGEIDKVINKTLAKLSPDYTEEIKKIAIKRDANLANVAKPKILIEDIHNFLDQSALRTNGKKLSLSNPADYTKIKDNLVNEIQVQLKQKVSGKGWYDADVLKTFNTLSRMPGFEKLGNNENHRVILSAILGATSPGPKVSQNVRAGLAQYLKWSRTGKFSTKSPPPGTSIEGIEKPGFGPFGFPQGLRMIEFLINKFGEGGFADFMLSTHTKKQLTNLRVEAGFGANVSGMSGTADSLHFGMAILGDKAGKFALNINGYKATTKDKWFVRTIRRQEGTFSDHLTKDRKGKLVELGQPKNQSERLLMDQLVKDIVADPKLKDLKLTEQDAQAILWYKEQNLYTDLGVDSRPETFSEGVENVSKQKGFGVRASDEDKVAIEQGTVEPGGFREFSTKQRAVRNSRREFQRINDPGGSGGVSRTYEGKGSENAGGDGVLRFEIKPEIKARYLKSGINSPVITKVDAKTSANQYSKDMADAMANDEFGLQVTLQKPEDLINSNLYRTEFGGGFVIKPDGEIVGVFNKPGSPSGSSYAMMQFAVEQGGKKLDAFNTFLPKVYETIGFKPVSRVKWDDAFAPEGWSKETFKEFNNGEPDLILYVYDPNYFGGVNKNDLPIFDGPDGYDQAQKIQQTELNKLDMGGTDGAT